MPETSTAWQNWGAGGRGAGALWGRFENSRERGRQGGADKAGKMNGGRAGGWEMNAKNGLGETFGLQGGGLGGGDIPNTPGPVASADCPQSAPGWPVRRAIQRVWATGNAQTHFQRLEHVLRDGTLSSGFYGAHRVRPGWAERGFPLVVLRLCSAGDVGFLSRTATVSRVRSRTSN